VAYVFDSDISCTYIGLSYSSLSVGVLRKVQQSATGSKWIMENLRFFGNRQCDESDDYPKTRLRGGEIRLAYSPNNRIGLCTTNDPGRFDESKRQMPPPRTKCPPDKMLIGPSTFQEQVFLKPKRLWKRELRRPTPLISL